MNTPAHAVLNALIVARDPSQNLLTPAVIGAILPDVPMVFFYVYQRIWAARPEFQIWGQLYFHASWQAFFDIFNSLPLVAVGGLLAWWIGSQRLGVFCMSMALHAVSDFLVHHNDAHRHFFPLTDWRFQSPVSYWDPRHHGDIFLLGESIFTLVGAIILTYWYRETSARFAFLGFAGVYGLYFIYALWMWA